MYQVDTYLRIRQACLVDRKSQRQVSQDFNLNRRTVSKMLTHSKPPGYCRKRKVAQPKLDPLTTDRQAKKAEAYSCAYF